MSDVEILGLAASICVLVAFLMRRIVVIRLISIVACILFVIYGLIEGLWVIWVLNAILIVIHLCYLMFGQRSKKEYRLGKLRREAFQVTGLRKIPLW